MDVISFGDGVADGLGQIENHVVQRVQPADFHQAKDDGVSDAQPGMTNKPNNNTIAINELHFFMRRFSKVGCMYGITFAGT